MGTVGVDITAMEIVERGDGWVVDDFMVTLPPNGLADTLVSTCNEIDGVKVQWISRYPDSWGLEGDIEVLNRMVAEPEHAAEILTEAAPLVFHCQWAALLDARTGEMLAGSDQAPDFDASNVAVLGELRKLRALSLQRDWLPMWGDTEAAICPVPGRRSLVLGRQGGPVFVDSELKRLQHLAAMS